MKKLLVPLLLVLALLCLSLTAGADANVLRFDRNVNLVFEGEKLQTVLVREGDPAGGELSYTSNNERVATVSKKGVVTGVSKGQATITATVVVNGRTFRTQLGVTVARKAASVEVDTSRLVVYKPSNPLVNKLLSAQAKKDRLPVLVLPLNKGLNLAVNVMPRDATNRRFVLTSSDPQIVTVQGSNVRGKGVGEAVVTIANELSPEVQTQYRVLVIQPVTRLKPVASAPSVAVGSQVSLTAEVTPENASIPKVVWSSSDERVATVDASGVVTGVRRGNARLVATAQDGSGVRANISIRVTQTAESVSLDQSQLTIDAGKSAMLRATVLPRDTDDKNVVWHSSNEKIATVNNQGRVTAVALGTCRITCSSRENGKARAVATIHVQQPVKSVTFGPELWVYIGESGQLTWTIEPANASNPALNLTAANTRVATVTNDGVVTPLNVGETWINAVTTDGSNRRARVKVKVMQHVEGVHMLRSTAYIDPGDTNTAGAILEPKTAGNNHMSWETADSGVATVSGDTNRVRITGVREGQTVVTGTTEDGGFQTSIKVIVGDFDHALRLTDAYVEGADIHLTVRNRSELNITSITAEVSVYDIDGNLVPCNSKDGSGTFKVVYRRTLGPGASTRDDGWKTVDFMLPDSPTVSTYVVKVTTYQIDNDWIKTIRRRNQPTRECPVHI